MTKTSNFMSIWLLLPFLVTQSWRFNRHGMTGAKLGREKFLQDTAVHIIRHRLAHDVQDRGRHIDQLSAFDFDSLPERLAVGNQDTVAAMRSAPFRSRGRFALEDFNRRFPRMVGKTWAGGKEAAVPPIE